jgi:putative phage-type endonuclease
MSAIQSGAAITPDKKADWLAERRKGIGASEAAAALGLSPFETPLGLYLRKTGQVPEPVETEAMRWGTLLEGPIGEEYCRRTGREIVHRQYFIRHPDRPHVSATCDAINDWGKPVEFKAVSGWTGKDLGEEESDEIPDHWLIQAQIQMALTFSEQCEFAVLIGGQTLRLFCVLANPELMGMILGKLDVFWRRVERRDPPPPDAAADARLIPLLYPDPSGTKVLGAEAGAIAERYEAWGAARREAEEGQAKAKAELLLALGDCREGVLADGRRVRRYDAVHPERTQVVKGYTATTVRVLKARG